MSKNTFFHTRFWQDLYISDLDPIEKLMFVYAITSPYLGLTGIYEVPLKYVAFETGLDKDMVKKIFDRFQKEKKIIYKNGWLCVVNYPKYQTFRGGKLQVAVEKEIARIPKDILEFFIENGYSIDSVSIPSRERDRERDMDKDREVDTSASEKLPDYPDVFETFWSAYPRKIGKANAWRSWQKVSPDLATTLIAIEKQKRTEQWKKEGGKYIPHPATWLNQERWEDEVTEVAVDNWIIN